MNSFVWLLLFLAIPIVVHLFNFRRTKRISFTNVRFIKQVSTEAKSRTRLKHLLILTSRILIFLLLITSFVLFVTSVSSQEEDKPNSLGSIFVDNSLSCFNNKFDPFTTATDIISNADATSGRLITNDFSPFSNQNRTMSEISDELEKRSVSYTSRSFGEVLDRMEGDYSKFLITDFQHVLANDFDRIRKDTLSNYYLILNETPALKNVYVDSLWIERDLDDYSVANIKCYLGSSSTFTEGNVVIKLIDENENQLSSIVTDIINDPEVIFSIPRGKEDLFLKVQLAGDDLDFDNEFYFIVKGYEQPTIIAMDQKSNKYVSSVFGNEELFDLDEVSSIQIDYEEIQNSQFVVLSGFFQLPEGLINQNIGQTAFLIVPGDSIDTSNYSSEMDLSIKRFYQNNPNEISIESNYAFTKGIFKRFKDITNLPVAQNLYRVYNEHERILSLRNGEGLLIRHASLPIFFFTTPLEDKYTNLPNHSIFLPVMYRLIESSSNSKAHSYVYPDQYLEVSNIRPDTPPKIISSSVEQIPEVRFNQLQGSIKIPGSLPPGFYHILQGKDTLDSFGLNLSKRESLLEGPTLQDLETFFADFEHIQVINLEEDYKRTLRAETDKLSFWKYALILALFFALVETMLHRYLK